MNIVRNMKVGAKLALAFAAVLALTASLAAVSLVKLGGVEHQWHEVEFVDMVKDSSLAKADKALLEAEVDVKNYLLKGGDYAKKANDEVSALEKAIGEYRAAGHITPKEDELLKAVSEGAKGLHAAIAKSVEMRAANVATTEIDKVMHVAEEAIEKPLHALDELSVAETKAASKVLDALIASARLWIWTLTGIAMILGAFFALLITRAITRPLKQAVMVAEAVASGDLTKNVQPTSNDEAGALIKALMKMNGNLRNIVGDVRSGTDEISTASGQIASGNADLSQRTEEQASSLEETASSMEELASTVKQNAENARQANQLAANASEVALKGGAVVGEVVETMSSINDSSKKISDIIGVIDGIAFQTNILALNAAVEAARAGEQGRGFAVVASEVRTLAQRSAGAAKEIKELISASVQKVEAGTRLVDNAGKTMDEIVGSVKRVTDIVADIAAATQEQSSGIEQVNVAVTQMDQVTQQNAALVEQAAAAAEAMREQCGSLSRAVAVFKMDEQRVAVESVEEPKVERRGPARAKNVARLPVKAARPESTAPMKKTGTDGDWSEF